MRCAGSAPQTKTACGSITVYYALIMVVMVSLIMGMIVSAKVKAGRMQAANSVDQAMFSLFARYDRKLKDEYGLYFLYAGDHGSDADLEACMGLIEDAMDYILKPNKGMPIPFVSKVLSLRRDSAYVRNCTLATDADGIPFESEAILAVKDSPALSAVSFLLEKRRAAAGAEEEGKVIMGDPDSYEEREESVQEASRRAKEELEEAKQNGEDVVEYTPPPGFKNPIPSLWELYGTGILSLVVPSDRSVSQKWVDKDGLPSHRKLASGMGIIDASGSAEAIDNISYVAWAGSHFGCFTDPKTEAGLEYQLEYLLKGDDNDEDNLARTVAEIKLIRQGINMLALFRDPVKMGMLSGICRTVGALLVIPGLGSVIEGILMFLWSYLESLVDLRALMSGKRVALIKDETTWQTDIEDFAQHGIFLDGLALDAPNGIGYKEYLLTLIFATERKKMTMRAMDMVEMHMRAAGRPDFRMDSCIYALGIEARVSSEGRVVFPVQADLSYGDL
ncbi:MAG: DUF5702 domain-containing protein [Lachnospiraceae bacterium]|nr:DUF5702 domain-containing protein [Lachnospiraceae bacterium]